MQQSSPSSLSPSPCSAHAVVDHPSERSSIYISNRISVFPHHRQHGPRLLGNVCDGGDDESEMTPQTGSVHSRTRGNVTARRCGSAFLLHFQPCCNRTAAARAEQQREGGLWTNRANRFCSGAVALEVAWELITVRASLHGLACEQVNRSLLQKRHSTHLMQARCSSLNGPSFAAGHCHPRQDDENRNCSGQCALRYA